MNVKLKAKECYLSISIYTIALILIFIPIFSTYYPDFSENPDGYWIEHFTYTNYLSSIPTLTLLISLSLYHLTNNRLKKKIFLLLSFFSSGFLFLFSASSLVMPIQDFWAENGLFFLVLFFPIVLVITYKEFTKKTKS